MESLIITKRGSYLTFLCNFNIQNYVQEREIKHGFLEYNTVFSDFTSFFIIGLLMWRRPDLSGGEFKLIKSPTFYSIKYIRSSNAYLLKHVGYIVLDL